MCNNAVFNNGMITLMKSMSDSARRLYEFAQKARPDIASQADLARTLNTSSMLIHNWEKRGVSKDGALLAEELFGCSAIWILKGFDPVKNRAWPFEVARDDYETLSDDTKRDIQDYIEMKIEKSRPLS